MTKYHINTKRSQKTASSTNITELGCKTLCTNLQNHHHHTSLKNLFHARVIKL